MIAELVCSVVALVLYVNTLGAGFCYDDSRAIRSNQDLLPETPWINIFYDDFWGTLLTHSGSHKSYRPLCTLSFRLNHALGGLEPWGYHLVNVSLHAGVTGLFARLSRLLLGGGRWALAAGLLFASHPVHTEAVAGVVGRADLGAGLFFLLSLLCYARHCAFRPGPSTSPAPAPGPSPARCWAWLLASLLLAACSMLWKEQGMTVLGVATAYDFFICHRLRLRPLIHLLREGRSCRVMLSLSLLATWGTVLLALRLYWMGNKPPSFSSSDNPAADSPSLLTRTLTFLYLPAANLWLLLCPSTLSFDWSMDALPLLNTLSDWRNLHTAAFCAGLLLLAHFGLRSPVQFCQDANGSTLVTEGHIANGNTHIVDGKPSSKGHSCHPEPRDEASKAHWCPAGAAGRTARPSAEGVVAFSLALLVLPFLPASNLLFYVGFVMAERVLYLPSMGFCLLLALGLRSLCARLGTLAARSALLCCTSALLFLFGAKTVLRNQDWHSEEALYRSGIAVNPAKAWGNLGNVLKDQGKMAEAERAYRNALYYRSNMADMLYNLGLLLQERQQFSEALQYYTLAIGSRPTLASAYLNTGIILMNQGHLDEAKRTFLICANIPDENLRDPHAHRSSVTSCLYNLGKLLHEQGHQEEAIAVFKEAVQKMPHQFAPQSLYNMMGEAYMGLNRLQLAEHWYQESLRAKPDHIPAHLTYAKLLAIRGRKLEAERYFLKAIDLDPGKGSTYMHYGQFLMEESHLVEAAKMAERAAQLEIGQFDVVFNSAHMLRQAGFNSAAEKYYELAANQRPNDPAALMNLGAILHLNGKLQQAEASYLQALQLKPDDVITQSNLRKLRNVMEKQGLKTAKP
ncbi:protein O-mannosyl-transferase TMTC2-like isoform X2 [Anguilla anguilla]|uniref:protein O-mannosyl-transferase TMTC2-like isoform X2 n=1 Tax=Anguilla anguilla TaxID=7936 RepID=UPI0015AC38DE|nr:protein O-mannosyl-transferase TMTC2-like isoform X2 [Anguilla anguilla]